jgi:membrane-bound serine protease (ClpP class)
LSIMNGDKATNGIGSFTESFAAGGRWILVVLLSVASIVCGQAEIEKTDPSQTAVIITCYGMIDDGLYNSIVRRGTEAVNRGADFVILDVQTYGGLVDSADDISKYLIHTLGRQAHTVAYVSTEAISAGAMISVSCEDIVMQENTTIGASAPIIMGDSEMGDAEREKNESFIRATFARAAQANNYPEALLKAMVSQNLEVWQVPNRQTGQMEYFESSYLPTDPNTYDLNSKKLVVREGELLTLTDQKALEYGIARAVVEDMDGVLKFLSERYAVTIADDVAVLETLWSEEMVRWVNSPVVSGLLIMGILLGIYVELHTPGLGLPSLLALTCLVILVGSKYLVGMANWIEVAVLAVGVLLLLLEIFVIPGFGIAGVSGIICIILGLFALLVQNAPDELPWPQSDYAWSLFIDGVIGILSGVVGFAVIAVLLARYLPKIVFLSGLTLKPSDAQSVQMGRSTAAQPKPGVQIGDVGKVETALRPAGTARFSGRLFDVVCQAEFIEKGDSVEIMQISGNRIMVRKTQEKT